MMVIKYKQCLLCCVLQSTSVLFEYVPVLVLLSLVLKQYISSARVRSSHDCSTNRSRVKGAVTSMA